MYRDCPDCKQPVQRRKKGCCPFCGVAIFIDGKKRCDKQVITDFLVLLEWHIKNRTNVSIRLTKNPAERSFAYKLLDKTRGFVADNQDVGLTPEEIFIQTFNYTMTYDRWWSRTVAEKKTCVIMSKSWNKHVSKFYSARLIEYNRIQAEKERLENTQQLSIEFSYDIV
jgi:hypothetical protein